MQPECTQSNSEQTSHDSSCPDTSLCGNSLQPPASPNLSPVHVCTVSHAEEKKHCMGNDTPLKNTLSMMVLTVSNRQDQFTLSDCQKSKHKFLWSPSAMKLWLINNTSIVQSFPKLCLHTMADPSGTTSLINVCALSNGTTFCTDPKPHHSSGSLGIMWAESRPPKSVFCLPNRDCAPFNEPQKAGGLKMLALTIFDMQECKANPN